MSKMRTNWRLPQITNPTWWRGKPMNSIREITITLNLWRKL